MRGGSGVGRGGRGEREERLVGRLGERLGRRGGV